ncbi:MAG: 50S ribosomal protein L10 [Candidatus Nealsonbacteria bacterium]
MPLTKDQKKRIVEDLKEKISRQKAIVFAVISGIKVKDLSSLKKKMKEQNCELKVAKKTLMSLAFKESKVDFDARKLNGEVALGFGYKDEVLPFKTLYEFSRSNENLKILGGIINRDFFEAEKAVELAKIPSREGLLARIVGSLNSPIVGTVNVLQGNLRNLVYALSQIQKVRS